MAIDNVWCLIIDHENKRVGTPFQVSAPNHASNIAYLREKVKEGMEIAVEADQHIVWRCNDPKVYADAGNQELERTINRIDFSDRAKVVELPWEKNTMSLEILGTETLLVQVPGPTKGPSTSYNMNLSGSTSGSAGARRNRDNYASHLRKSLHKEIYEKVWGRPWPHRSSNIIAVDYGAKGEGHTQLHDEPDSDSREEEFQRCWAYECLGGIKALGQSLTMPTAVPPKLVIQKEYEFARIALESRADPGMSEYPVRSFVVIGQPGIGKTMFLLYLLLYRLERCLPTAIQVGPQHYFVFDASGVGVFNVNDISTTLLSPDCWALCDGNQFINQPCFAFQASRAVVIQATSGRENRWKGWRKQRDVQVIIMDVPRLIEIAVIAQEVGLNSREAIAITQRWGPETRNVLNILKGRYPKTQYRQEVQLAAVKVVRDPRITTHGNLDRVTEIASSLLFLRPVRDPVLELGNEPDLRDHVLEIPTRTLAEIFEDELENLSDKEALDVFAAFSSHSLVKTASGWANRKVKPKIK